jgi:hypothetical protein
MKAGVLRRKMYICLAEVITTRYKDRYIGCIGYPGQKQT